MKHFDVIVVGSGIVGAAILNELTVRGKKRCLLLEAKEQLASETTFFSAGMLRCFHQDTRHFEWALEGLSYYSSFFSDCIERVGAVSFLRPEQDAQRALKKMSDWDTPVEVISAAEGKKRFPIFAWEEEDIALFEPRAGFLDSSFVARELIKLAERNGARVLTSCPLLSFESKFGRARVETHAGTFSADCLVLATGLATEELLKNAGINLALSVKPIQLSEYFLGDVRGPIPNVFDYNTNLFTRFNPHTRRLLLGLPVADVTSPGTTNREPDLAVAQRAFETARMRIPALQTLSSERSTRHFDVNTEGRLGVIGFIPGFPSLYVATGWGGTGVKFAPAIAQQAREDICDSRKGTGGFHAHL